MRNEQKNAVEMTKAYFMQAKADDPTRPPKFLWNAIMQSFKSIVFQPYTFLVVFFTKFIAARIFLRLCAGEPLAYGGK